MRFIVPSEWVIGKTIENYMHRRNDAKEKQRKTGSGGAVTLNTKERIVNESLMDLKLKGLYYHKSNNDCQHFPPTNHFLKVREDVEMSDVSKSSKWCQRVGLYILCVKFIFQL